MSGCRSSSKTAVRHGSSPRSLLKILEFGIDRKKKRRTGRERGLGNAPSFLDFLAKGKAIRGQFPAGVEAGLVVQRHSHSPITFRAAELAGISRNRRLRSSACRLPFYPHLRKYAYHTRKHALISSDNPTKQFTMRR